MKKTLFAFAALALCTSLFFAEEADNPEWESFTDEPLEDYEEDEGYLELLKTALLPEITPLDVPETEKGPAVQHISLSFISDEEINKPQVEAFRKMYLSPKWSALLKGYLEGAMEYRLYVRKAVSDKQLPEMLEYLPVV